MSSFVTSSTSSIRSHGHADETTACTICAGLINELYDLDERTARICACCCMPIFYRVEHLCLPSDSRRGRITQECVDFLRRRKSRVFIFNPNDPESYDKMNAFTAYPYRGGRDCYSIPPQEYYDIGKNGVVYPVNLV